MKTISLKKIALIATFVLFGATALAQDGKSIYNKYSDEKNVSAVYISQSMFKLMGKIPELELPDGDVNISPYIKEMTGMYLINSENPKTSAALAEDAEKLVRSGKYELLLEAKDDGERLRVYIVPEGEYVTSFVMTATEEDECTFISIEGKILRDDLETLLAKAMKN